MKYFIVIANDSELLEDAVIERMENGWQLQGGISVSFADPQFDDGTFLFAQAMVKK